MYEVELRTTVTVSVFIYYCFHPLPTSIKPSEERYKLDLGSITVVQKGFGGLMYGRGGGRARLIIVLKMFGFILGRDVVSEAF